MLYYAEYREGIGTAELVCDTSEDLKRQGSIGFAIEASPVTRFASSKVAGERRHVSVPFAVECGTQMPSAKDIGQGMISVRFPRQTITALPLSISGEARGNHLNNAQEFVSWAATNDGFPYTLQCAFCKKRLSRERSIVQRALPLPSEEFREMVSDLFCHGSSSAAQRVMAGDLVPRQEECLLSESLIVFRLSSLLQESMLLENVDQQHCEAASNSEEDSQANAEKIPSTSTISDSQTPISPQNTPSVNQGTLTESTDAPSDPHSTSDRDTPTMAVRASSSSPHSNCYSVKCTRCFSLIGQGRVFGQSTTELHSTQDEAVTSITFKWESVTLQTKGFAPIGGKVCPMMGREQLEANFMHKLTALSGSSGRYRFLLKDPAGFVYACVWHINSNVRIATNALSTGGSAFEDYSGQSVGGQGLDAAPVSRSDTITDSDNVAGDGLNVKCFRAMKVLYKSCLRDTEGHGISTAASWELDGSVTDMVFSLVECLQVLLVLEENNRSLPPAMRVANTFNIAYFKYSNP